MSNYKNKTGKHWYNNGVTQVQAFECPEGFVLGRLPITEETKKKISKSLMGHPSSVKGVPKSEETKRKISETRKERKIQAWNKGLTAETDDRVAKNGQATKKTCIERGNYVAWNRGLTADTDERVRMNRAKSEATMVERYGVPNPSLRTDVEHVAWNKGLTKETDGRMKKASENHIGVTAWNKGLTEDTDERVKKYAESGRTERCKRLRYLTRQKNGTFNSSSQETTYFVKLKGLFGSENVIQQYKDQRYPFHCDFYIKSLDLFIELNLHWTHGGRPFDPSDESCQKQLALWEEKSKTSMYYITAIKVWTLNDVEKVNVAHRNNITLIVLYEDNFDELLSSIKKKFLMIKPREFRETLII